MKEEEIVNSVRSTYFLLFCIVLAVVLTMAIKREVSNVPVKTPPPTPYYGKAK